MKCFISIVLLSCFFFAFGQQEITFSLVTEKSKIEIGDPLLTSLRVTYSAKINPSEISLPEMQKGQIISDTIEVLEVMAPTSTTSQDNNGNPTIIWEQNFVVGIYAGGNIPVGPFSLIVNSAEKTDTLESNIATIVVATPELQEDAEFMEIKGIEQDPFTTWEKILLWLKTYWWAIALPLGLIVSFLAIRYYIANRSKEKVVFIPKISLPQSLLNKLLEIEEQKLWQQEKHKIYYSEVTDVIRKYLEYKYEIPTLEKTSDEILQSLTLSGINKNDFNQLKNLFHLSNMIKFAKSLPTSEENIMAMTIAKGLLNKELKKSK